MLQKHNTQTNASKQDTELRGKIGEYYIQSELAKIGIDSVSIDKTFDLYLWQRNHRIEIKTSKPHDKKNCKTQTYCFRFEKSQCIKAVNGEDAFDYAICVGYNPDNSIDKVYIIPQRYLEKTRTRKTKTGELMIQILTKPANKFMVCSSYKKFKPCREIGLDIFLNNNKSSFTRKKNTLTKNLLKYDDASKKGFRHTFITHFKNGGNVKQATKIFNMNHTAVVDWRLKFGLTKKRSKK